MARLVNMPNAYPNSFSQYNSDLPELKDNNDDALIEEILENITSTPLGQVLKRMSELPEIRKGKVLRMRQQITSGLYDEDDRLDAAMDRVIEEITAS